MLENLQIVMSKDILLIKKRHEQKKEKKVKIVPKNTSVDNFIKFQSAWIM